MRVGDTKGKELFLILVDKIFQAWILPLACLVPNDVPLHGLRHSMDLSLLPRDELSFLHSLYLKNANRIPHCLGPPTPAAVFTGKINHSLITSGG